MVQEKIKFRLKGHESFILREGWLTKGLFAVNANPGVFAENFGADDLGVGTNMAKSIRYWLKSAGLTIEEAKGQVRLSSLGEMLLKEDAYFEDLFSLWLIHIHLTQNFEQASVWNLFFNKCEKEVFTRKDLEEELKENLSEIVQGESFSERSLQDDCEALLQMYTRKHVYGMDPEEKKVSPFQRLGLLKEQDGSYRREQPELKKIDALLVLYVVQNILEEQQGYFQTSVDKLLFMENSPGRILQLRRSYLMQYLEELAQKNYLTMNRTAGLNMVYQQRKYTPEEILKDYFGGKRTTYERFEGITGNR